jgi:hypothetical protein
MESNGAPNKIHVSASTAEELISLGKEYVYGMNVKSLFDPEN